MTRPAMEFAVKIRNILRQEKMILCEVRDLLYFLFRIVVMILKMTQDIPHFPYSF